MFKKLRLQLTIYNAVILTVFMIIFSLFIYVVMSKIVLLRIDNTLRFEAHKVDNLNQIPPINFGKINFHKPIPEDEPIINIFKIDFFDKNTYNKDKRLEINYILRDEGLNIITSSSSSSTKDSSFLSKALVYAKKTQRESRNSYVTLDTAEGKIRLFTTVFNKNGQKGFVQTYTNIDREIGFLSSLMAILIGMGLASIIILVTIGWILAGRSIKPINKSWQQQKDFIADASHELRTPLTVLQTNLEILLSDPKKTIEENINWINNIRIEANMMSKLIDDLLLIARMDSKQIKMNKEVFNISELVDETVNKIASILNKKVEIEKQIKPDVEMYGDKLRIKQVLNIFLDNAVKYTLPGGKITVQLSSNQKYIYIKVKDTGIGISKEDMERIFDRFYRADKARSRREGGTGLGLSIASWIVKEHNGRIEVESKLGKGSVFTIVFPA